MSSRLRNFLRPKSISLSAILHIAMARLREFYREPAALLWVYGFPQIIMITLGFAFTDRPPETFHVDLIWQAVPQPWQQSVRENLQKESRLILEEYPWQESQERLQQVSTSAILITSASETDVPKFKIIFDPDRVDSSQARALLEAALLRISNESMRVETEVLQQYGGRYIDFLVPGLLAVGIMGGSLVGMGYTLVEMRLRKQLRVYLATPLQREELFLGLMLSRIAFLIPEIGLVLVVAYLVFGVIMVGNVLLLLLALLTGTLAFLGIGLLIGSRGKTLEGISGWVSLLMLVQWVFCGVFFSRGVFPQEWQTLLACLPLSALVDATRGVFLDRSGFSAIAPQLGILAGWTAVTFPLALWRFRSE